MTYATLNLEKRDGVAWITLNRPEALNAINDEIREGLAVTMEALDQDDAIRVVVVRSAGPRAFSVGADIKEVRPAETAIEARERLARSAWSEAVAACSKPVIASIHGYCLGGGMELALACDVRIAAAGAVFALPEIDLGLLPGGGGTQRLARLVGLGRALDLILSGDRLDASRAYELGLVTRISACVDTLVADTDSLALRLAAKPAQALKLIKEAVVAGCDLPLGEGLKLERNLFSLLLSTEDRLEAAAAFREKRPARFTAR